MKASEKAKAARSARGRKEGSRLFLASMRASRDAGTWGLTKNSKMAAVRNGGFLLPRFEYFQGL